MTRSTDITSFTEHRKRLREHFDECRRTGRPLFVTSNGETDAIVLSPEAYDKLSESAEIIANVAAVEAGFAELQAGKTRPAREAIRAVARELGLDLDE